MESLNLDIISIFLSFNAGLLSVFSPCIFPVLPIIMTGSEKDSKKRPLLIVIGLAFAFVGMGIISTLFGHILAGNIIYIEKIGAIIILILGILMLINKNIFKKLNFGNKLKGKLNFKNKTIQSLLLGAALGIIWIPCTGPILGSILTTVAIQGTLFSGIILLLVYSIGFSIPILIVGYSSQYIRKKLFKLLHHSNKIRIVSGIILIVFGIYLLFHGNFIFSLS